MTSELNPQPSLTPPRPQTPAQYYSSPAQGLELGAEFLNIDDRSTYYSRIERLGLPGTKNFVTDVWSNSAWCAVDVAAQDIKLLLNAKRPPRSQNEQWIETRWINIWGGDLQTDTVGALADHYGLTPRLKGLMCAGAVQSGRSIDESRQSPSQQYNDSDQSPTEKMQDEEAAFAASASPTAGNQTLEKMELTDIQWGHIVNEIWHWHTVDWGQRYLCLGYNSVFTVKDIKLDNGPNKPQGKRIWTWLILCDDGTVISVYENPFPHMAPDAKVLKAVLKIIRRNVHNVFLHLSRVCNTADHPNKLMTVQIRDFNPSAQAVDSTRPLEAASKLLYYLFDDWTTTYGLVAKKEHPYGRELEKIRSSMLTVARINLVDNLHQIGRRLAVLKRVYQSYDQMVTRILQRQRLLRDEARQKAKEQPEPRPVMFPTNEEDNERRANLYHSSNMLLSASDDMLLGVCLSSSAIVRFERLLDRIKLYAISEIEECLTEKESLVFMVCPTLPAPYSVSLTLVELQSNTAERGPSGGEAYENHDCSCKSDHHVLTSQSDDRLLFRFNT